MSKCYFKINLPKTTVIMINFLNQLHIFWYNGLLPSTLETSLYTVAIKYNEKITISIKRSWFNF